MPGRWPGDEASLIAEQERLASLDVPPWWPPARRLVIGACFVCFSGDAGAETGWAAAVLAEGHRLAGCAVCRAPVEHPYAPGLLALREGPLLERAVRSLPRLPDALIVNAGGRDHPRRAGLALHLGAVLEIPSAGVTDRPLMAEGPQPGVARLSAAPLKVAGETVGYRLVSRAGARPVAVHAAFRTDPESARELVVRTLRRARTPEPLRWARREARLARARGTASPLAE
ncbi:MAG TPA: endonuclease V [Actinomycetota bacterium]|jgi:deoxyribonuclease V|nr:endonuclease V [Actinomycetota bacterium]